MNSNFTKKLVKMDSIDVVQRALRERRDEILGAIGDRTVEPTPDLMKELAELNIAIGDFPAEDFSDEQ
jgi:hypothetical protein